MAKQPYIPFYLGDYIKDTRKLPLVARGAWMDLLLFMWNDNKSGEISGTFEDFSRLLSCSAEDAKFALGLLIENGVCDHEKLSENRTKIISRRMKRDVELSIKRSKSGKHGVKQKKKIAEAKHKQITEYEYVFENGNGNDFSLEGKGNLSLNEKLELPPTVLEAAEMNQFTHTKSRNTDFVKSQWHIFLKERMNDPPKRWNNLSELTRYFLNFSRDKFPKNGTTYQRNPSVNGAIKETVKSSGGFGQL